MDSIKIEVDSSFDSPEFLRALENCLRYQYMVKYEFDMHGTPVTGGTRSTKVRQVLEKDTFELFRKFDQNKNSSYLNDKKLIEDLYSSFNIPLYKDIPQQVYFLQHRSNYVQMPPEENFIRIVPKYLLRLGAYDILSFALNDIALHPHYPTPNISFDEWKNYHWNPVSLEKWFDKRLDEENRRWFKSKKIIEMLNQCREITLQQNEAFYSKIKPIYLEIQSSFEYLNQKRKNYFNR